MKKHEITEMTIAMRTGNLKMENDGDYWSDEDRRKLSDRFYAGASYNEIALELGRTEPAVQQQIEQMQLYVKSTRAPESAVLPPSPLSAYVPSAPLTGANVPAASITSKCRR